MSHFVKYEACEKCRERGKDSRKDNLAVYSDGSGHCFACSWHRHPPSGSHWVPRVEEVENKAKRILPDDFTKDVPARCWGWLLQYGLPYDYWKDLVGYSEKYERLVFRVGTPLHFSIGRYLPKEKGDAANLRKWHVWGDAHQSVEAAGESRSITLVEDYISYHKVAAAGNQVVCLFGTRIYPPVLEYLRKQNKSINIWLDEDQSDVVMRQASNLSILTGCKVNIIRTNKDPKEYNAKEINRYIAECSN